VAILQVGPDEAGDLVKRIQGAVGKHDFMIAGSTVSVGISVGWACFGVDGHTFDELLIGADRSMYADKARRKSAISPPGQSARLHHDYNRIM
jgi:GGDEF domain-containing protein